MALWRAHEPVVSIICIHELDGVARIIFCGVGFTYFWCDTIGVTTNTCSLPLPDVC